MRWDGDGHTLAQRLPAEELTADLSAVHLQPVPAPRLQTHGTQCRLPHARARTRAHTPCSGGSKTAGQAEQRASNGWQAAKLRGDTRTGWGT